MKRSKIAMLIYLQANGLLETAMIVIEDYFLHGARSMLIIFWMMAFPILLVAFLIFMVVRRNKVKKTVTPYERGVKTAIEAERANFIAKQTTARFAPIDTQEVSFSDDVGSLKELCDQFIRYAANLKLYFSEREVREFVSALASSHLLILRGISGSGKTALAYAFGEFLGNPSTVIPVQPMWKERSDLIGYYNEFTRHYNDTPLFRKMYEANESNGIFITVLDEMNIARVEYYFAEFLSLMEIPDPDLRMIELVSDKCDTDPDGIDNGRIKLPENMWFIGTVNDDDSAFAISDKVYDRAMLVDLSGRGDKTDRGAASKLRLSYKRFVELATLNGGISSANEKRIAEVEKFLLERLNVAFGNRIRRQMTDYVLAFVACGGDEIEAVDDILCKKVLRKLEYKDISMHKKDLDEFKALFVSQFGGKATSCARYIDSLLRRD